MSKQQQKENQKKIIGKVKKLAQKDEYKLIKKKNNNQEKNKNYLKNNKNNKIHSLSKNLSEKKSKSEKIQNQYLYYKSTMLDSSDKNKIRQSQQCLKIFSNIGGSFLNSQSQYQGLLCVAQLQPLKMSLTEGKINLIITQQIALSPSDIVQYVSNELKQKDNGIAIINPHQQKNQISRIQQEAQSKIRQQKPRYIKAWQASFFSAQTPQIKKKLKVIKTQNNLLLIQIKLSFKKNQLEICFNSPKLPKIIQRKNRYKIKQIKSKLIIKGKRMKNKIQIFQVIINTIYYYKHNQSNKVQLTQPPPSLLSQ